jgi:dihydroorotate dehydrogenase (fumarate)
MDLSTRYLGLTLSHPILPGASPLADTLEGARRLEDAGAPAIVLRSLFQEEIEARDMAHFRTSALTADSHPEASRYVPNVPMLTHTAESYADHVNRVAQCVKVPVIASLNSRGLGSWVEHASRLQDAGAAAMELNIYQLPSDPRQGAAEIESQVVEIVRAVRLALSIGLAVKLSPFYTALPHLLGQVHKAGADAVIIFNRLYQADIDIEALENRRVMRLSTSEELQLRLRWAAILSSRLEVPLAISGGVHGVHDAIKALMCGATCVQMVSALLEKGVAHLGVIQRGLDHWLVEHGYESLSQLRGSMNLSRCPDPSAYERVDYMHLLHDRYHSLVDKNDETEGSAK